MTLQQSLLPFPQFTNVFIQQYNGTNRYNALQLQANKRFSQGLTLTSTYTFSNLREKVNYLNPSDTQLEDRISTLDRPHRFTFSGVYELPIGRGRLIGDQMNGVLDAIVGGWQVNGIATLSMLKLAPRMRLARRRMGMRAACGLVPGSRIRKWPCESRVALSSRRLLPLIWAAICRAIKRCSRGLRRSRKCTSCSR